MFKKREKEPLQARFIAGFRAPQSVKFDVMNKTTCNGVL